MKDVSVIKYTMYNIERKLDQLLSAGQDTRQPQELPIISCPFNALDEFLNFDKELTKDRQLKVVSYEKLSISLCNVFIILIGFILETDVNEMWRGSIV